MTKSDAQIFTELTGGCWHGWERENILYKKGLDAKICKHCGIYWNIDLQNPTYSNAADILKRMREYCGEEKYKKFFTEIATKRNGEYLELMTIYEFVATYILNPPALLKKAVEFLKGDER